jgi:hypothetical protein
MYIEDTTASENLALFVPVNNIRSNFSGFHSKFLTIWISGAYHFYLKPVRFTYFYFIDFIDGFYLTTERIKIYIPSLVPVSVRF